MSDIVPQLGQIIARAIASRLAQVRVSLPGRILAYDDATRRARVQIEIQDVTADQTGARVTVTLKPINNVPVVFPGCDGRRIKFPVRIGALVPVVFTSSPLDKWKIKGGVVDPLSDRHHHLTDAYIQAGDFDPAAEDGEAMIEFTDDGRILVGGTSALVTKAEFEAHTHDYIDTNDAGAHTLTTDPPDPIAGTQILKGA